MPDIWQQQLTELRERFRQLCDHRNPLFHILVEGSEIAQAPLMLLPDTAVIARHFGSEDPGMCPVDKWVGEIPEDKAFRYSNGEIAGIQRPAIHRIHEFRCAVHREVEFFTRAAKDVIDLIRIFPPTVTSRFPSSIQDLCRTVKPRLTVFDTVRNSSGDSDWMVLMHRLGWIHNPQWRLEARRFCWGDEGHLQIAIDPEIPEKHRPPQITEMLKRVNTNRWFSILGEKAALDVFDASMRTIDVLLGYANETRMGSLGILETPKSVIPIPTQTEHLPSGDWLMPPLSLTEIGKRIGNANKKKIHTLLDQYKLRNYPEGNRQSWSVCLDPPMPRSLRQQLEALPAKK
jgi:hypothetical protein